MKREEKVVLYCMGMLSDLADKGFVERGAIRITKSGMKNYRKIKAEGFIPSESEIELAMSAIQDRCLVETTS